MPCRHYFAVQTGFESAFTVDSTSFTFGPGILQEVGDHAKALGMSRIAIITDKTVRTLPCVADAVQSLLSANLDFDIFDEVEIEPTDQSCLKAIRFAIDGRFDGFISIGGGSVIDTTKIVNLYSTYPAEDITHYVMTPKIGKANKVPGTVKPHIACPTTCGTGTEGTRGALFKYLPAKMKCLVVAPSLRPNLALIDPSATYSLPKNVVVASAFDILAHALEAITARPYTKRQKPKSALERPFHHGANHWSDVGAEAAIRRIGKYMVRGVNDASDTEARDQLMFASTLAGSAMGNCGTHLPHAMSYAVAGFNKQYHCEGYPAQTPLVPHGISVIVNAPSVFRFLSVACPERHLECAEFLGADTRGARPEDAGELLAKEIIKLMRSTGTPNGIGPLGYSTGDADNLASAVCEYHSRLLLNCPREVTEDHLKALFRESVSYW